ncbi:carbonic anhydrase [Bartonella sp. HY761]|uniref:carbonic anhydrase n=1 Tax=Bartonella sp. HY761 TaxID=2979330 RepID=UPI0022091C01|nr:carbonic anhydrase family protein [Bartonella sp. HY761]UXN05658.1 carbonic anhydrase family protein [Bartonella sp. HY761]
MKKIKTLILSSVFSLSLVCVASAGVHWGYEGAEGPEYWGDLAPEYAQCKIGKNQSPIDIQEIHESSEKSPIKIHYEITADELVNNGHTIQVSPKNADDYLTFKGEKYFLKQFHFHVPSENTILKRSFPLEAHFVHATKEGKLLVLAVMFNEGEESKSFKQILSSIPEEHDKTVDVGEEIDLDDMIPNTEHYYHFDGSLTTPPCSEGVTWIVLKDTKTIGKDQVEALAKILKHHNNRPIQPLNDRKVDEN